MSPDKKYSTPSLLSAQIVVVPNGAWAPRELSEKSVHVYSYFTLIKRMVLDSYITIVYICLQ